MPYPNAIQFLDSFQNYEKSLLSSYPKDFPLARVEQFLERLGNPHRKYPVLHVAGTKGKGSVCAFTASILQAAGFRVGLYTSPHLVDFSERLQINGRPISDEALERIVDQVRCAVSGELTYFEVTTACAFLYFALQKVDVAVIEVGLGGRCDATNVVHPEVTGITPISLDHAELLGFTPEEIAREKAGIIKTGVPVVVAPQLAPVMSVFDEIASSRKAPLCCLSDEVRAKEIQPSIAGTKCVLETPQRKYPNLLVPLLGRHQVWNAATAIRMVELLGQLQPKFSISIEAVREGISKTIWPGRCQWVEGNPPILLDGAHNQASAQALRQTLEELAADRDIVLIFGTSHDKEIGGMASVLGPWASKLILTQSRSPRAATSEFLSGFFSQWHPHSKRIASVSQAIEEARSQAGPRDLIVVAGSLFLVGEALEVLAGSSVCAGA